MPSNFLVWDRLRFFTKEFNIFPAERIYQNQPQLDKMAGGLEFFDGNTQTAILDQTNLQINRLERYRDYELMDQTGEISLALDLYADEGAMFDPERKHTLIIRAKTKRVKKALEELYFHILQWDNHCRPAIRYLSKFGDFPAEIITNVDRTGVASLRFMNVYNFTRVETRHGDLIGFFYQDENYPKPQFLHPWQVMHLRLTSFENLYYPYGKSVIDGGRKAFKQLRLMEDAALIYRITRASEKRKFIIPVGDIPTHQIPQFIEQVARQFKRQRFYNPVTGTFDERYSPLIQEDDIFLPRRSDGTGPDVDTLPGAENLDQIADIEYFKKKMISATKVPFSRVGIGDGAGEANERSASQTDSQFAKSVQWIQRELANGLKKVGIIHLALKGFSVDEIKGFDLSLTATSAMEELYRIEAWQTRAAVMAELKDLSWFPKEWIVTHFTDLSPDEIEELKDMDSTEGQGGPGGGGPPGGGLGGMDMGDEAMADGMDDAAKNQTDDDDMPGDNGAMLTGAQPEPAPSPLEGLDIGAQRRVLNEMKRAKRKAILEKMAARLNKLPEANGVELESGYESLIAQCELDGLTSSEHKDSADKVLSEDKSDEVLFPTKPLYAYRIPVEERMEAIKEVLAVITEDDHSAANAEATEVTDTDIPSK